MELEERLKLYLKLSTSFLVSMVVAFVAGTLISILHEAAGHVVVLLLSLLIFLSLQIQLGVKLTSEETTYRFLKVGFILALAVLLLFVKVAVNEELSYSSSCIGRLSEMTRMINYYSFSLWSTLFIWEAFYLIMNKVAKLTRTLAP